ncbi:hypothetical protein ACROYT_G027840 [Oculina patagonica]
MTLNSLPNDKLRLLIVVKAKVKEDGFCYIGWDMERHKLVRPVLRICSFRWLRRDAELQIGEQHLFRIKRFPLEGTSYPHRTNDILVEHIGPYYKAADNSDVDEELYNILMSQSHENIKEVFGNNYQFDGKCVFEHTKCPSVGIYKCKRRNLQKKPRRRCEIRSEDEVDVFNYMITAVDDWLPDVDINEEILVILGLARPYSGSSFQYTRLRCFVIVVGFVTKCTSAQNCSRFESQLTQSEGLNLNGIYSDVNYLSPQSLALGRKRKLEESEDECKNFAIEGKLTSRRLKT